MKWIYEDVRTNL